MIVRDMERVEAGQVARLASAGVATVHEAAGRSGLLASYMRPIYPGAAAAGSAVTVLCAPGDNLMIHLAIECCRPGDILVVGTTSPSTDGYIGELLATSLRAHGVVGVVIDAGVRDVSMLREMEFPLWSRAVSAQGTVKATAGSVNVPIVCANQLVCPGDAVVADDDGIVRIERSAAEEIASAAEKRVAREDATREKLSHGELGADIYGLREVAERLGITYVASAPSGEAANR